MSEMEQLKGQVEELTVALEQFGIFNQNASKKMGLFEQQTSKLKSAFKGSPIYGLAQTFKGLGQSVVNITKLSATYTAQGEKSREKLKKNSTVLQKFTAGLTKFGAVQKMNNGLLKIANNRFTRLGASVFSLLSIFLVVGFALAALSIAFDGANSPVLKMTENLGPLHDAMQGLVLVMTGEGDEGGLSSSLDVLAAGLLAAGVASILLGGQIGIIVGAAVLAVGAYRILNAEFENTRLALVGAIGVFATTVGSIMILKSVIVAFATGAQVAIAGTVGGVIAGVGLFIGGIAGMVAYMTGAGEGIKGILIGVVSAFALAIGAILVGVAFVPAAIGAAIVLLIATLIRYREEIGDFLKRAGTALKNGVSNTLSSVHDRFVSPLKKLVGSVRGIRVKVMAVFVRLLVSLEGRMERFVSRMTGGVKNLITGFVNLPSNIKSGLQSGMTSAMEAIIKPYNNFARSMTFDIPDWVPGVGGEEFKLPQIPMLAKGGYVNSPTLAMIGEDGPEAVVPLNRKNNPTGLGMGGGMTVNINVGGVTDRTDKKQLAREIGDLIRAEMSRGGRSHGNRRSSV